MNFDDFTPYPLDPRYGVSRDGRVCRFVQRGRYAPGECARCFSHGYWVTRIGGIQIGVHQIVAATFIPNPENKPEAAHWDNDRSNNTVENLRWATRKENEEDKVRHGTLTLGTRNGMVKLTPNQVTYVKQMLTGKPRGVPPLHQDIADELGVNRSCVTRIANGKRWSHATAS